MEGAVVFFLSHRGPDTKERYAFKESNPLSRSWFSGNSMDGVIPDDPWSLVKGAPMRLTSPLFVAPVRPESAAAAFERVLRTAGASHARDAVDLRIIEHVRNRGGKIIDSQEDVGGWPQLDLTAAGQ